MFGFLYWLKERYNLFTPFIFIFIAVLSMIHDGRRYKSKNNNKEYKIIKAFSYSYIVLGIVIFVLLWIS
ncbi:MAG TPA: hypothetical protein GXX53_06245 [Tissierellia bacterium]|nr:hypothetical protein [Tissierellia bacterium]